MNLHLFKLLLFEVLTRCLLADHSFKKVRVHLSADELQMCDGGLPLSGHYITSQVSHDSLHLEMSLSKIIINLLHSILLQKHLVSLIKLRRR